MGDLNVSVSTYRIYQMTKQAYEFGKVIQNIVWYIGNVDCIIYELFLTRGVNPRLHKQSNSITVKVLKSYFGTTNQNMSHF